jgi:hypothetical protein
LRLIATAFVLVAIYLSIQATWVLIVGHRAGHSPAGIAWTAITAVGGRPIVPLRRSATISTTR